MLAVGPVKSAASSAILTLPPLLFRRSRPTAEPGPAAPGLRAPATVGGRAGVEPGCPPRPAELDLVFHTERGTPVNPLRYADGGALAQRIYIHQLPQTAPRLAELIQGVFGPAAGIAEQCRPRDSEGIPTLKARLTGAQRRGRCVTDRRVDPQMRLVPWVTREHGRTTSSDSASTISTTRCSSASGPLKMTKPASTSPSMKDACR